MRKGWFLVASLGSLIALEGAAAAVELKNDGFVDGEAVNFQGGFAMGEIGASRFTPAPGAQLLGVQFLFGGVPGTRTITLRVWDDSGMQDNPGTELFSRDYTVNAADDQLQFIELSADNVVVPGTFRVGIEFQHSGLPSIARDDDGTIDGTKNFIRSNSVGWVSSTFYDLAGDWIIRAEVSGGGGSGSTTSSSSSSGAGGDGSGAGGPGGECQGNQDCPVGQYCSDAGACTLDCRVHSDCPAGNQCNTLGQCVAGAPADDSSGDDGGCNTAPAAGSAGVVGLLGGLAALAAAFRRRRG